MPKRHWMPTILAGIIVLCYSFMVYFYTTNDPIVYRTLSFYMRLNSLRIKKWCRIGPLVESFHIYCWIFPVQTAKERWPVLLHPLKRQRPWLSCQTGGPSTHTRWRPLWHNRTCKASKMGDPATQRRLQPVQVVPKQPQVGPPKHRWRIGQRIAAETRRNCW